MHDEIITRQDAMEFLIGLQPMWLDRVWRDGDLSNMKKHLMYNARGTDVKADLITYELLNAICKLIAAPPIG